MPYSNLPRSQWGKMDSCVAKVMKRDGVSKKRAIAICHASISKESEMSDSNTDSVTASSNTSSDLLKQLDNLENDELQEKGYVAWGVTSFSDLDAQREAQELAAKTYSLSDDLIQIVRNIVHDEDVSNKAASIKQAADEFSNRVDSLQVKEADEVKESIVPDMDILLWKDKDTDQYAFFARYSNKFRDDDNPPEIIASASHERFVKMVDDDIYPMPELWIWHEKDWRIGRANWVAYDSSGFSLASGLVDKGKEPVAKALAKLPPGLLKMSHGMPLSSIKRDPNDETIIIEHQTTEISILPADVAANKMTEWMVFTNDVKEASMSIPSDKKQAIADMGLDESVLDAVENANAADAAKANIAGIESKAKNAEVDEVTAEEEVQETEAETEDTEAETASATDTDEEKAANPLTREEVVEALTPIIQLQNKQQEVIEELTAAVKSLRGDAEEDETTEDKDVGDNAPTASLVDMLAKSIIGNPAARVDGRTTLAKDGPKETPPEGDVEKQVTGIRHVDLIFNDNGGE